MLGIVNIVLPVFGLMLVGYIGRRLHLLADRAGDGLSDFVFVIAIPCLIFKTLATARIPLSQPWGYWIGYFAGVAVVWAAAHVVARRRFGLGHTEAVVAGFSAGQSNTLLVGVPIILKAYGEAGAVPLFLLLAVHLPVTMTAATLLAEGKGASLATIARRLATHPILIAIFAGSAVRMLPPLPVTVWTIIDELAAAAIPCALVGMGIALRRYGIPAGFALPGIIAALKLVIHPLIVYLLTFHVFSMPAAWAGVATLFACCPSGVNAYLLAERCRAGVAVASSAIALSTGLSIATTVAWLWVLGV
ncbi:AEC family transporter [Chelatococcus reniformis]|uniref:Transporter n=1 Tax=Chelatococcus reniformis TaxID=1494448 RepID=A0A916X7H4_9HYPH|nr:AEC family transporter [Chelatococcus reniformis]GGC44855.1 transporter [Chelatococcus reniformis]